MYPQHDISSFCTVLLMYVARDDCVWRWCLNTVSSASTSISSFKFMLIVWSRAVQCTISSTGMGMKPNLLFPLDVQKLKGFQLQRASSPNLLTRGSAPGLRWGLCPGIPIIGSHSRTHHVATLLSKPSGSPHGIKMVCT